MPEIAEGEIPLSFLRSKIYDSMIIQLILTCLPVARIVHHLRKSLVGKTLSVVTAQDDQNVYGKVGTSAAEFQKSLTGKKVLSAGQQGKYFWYVAGFVLG